jgi:hypothetical protein
MIILRDAYARAVNYTFVNIWRFREFYQCRKFHQAWGVPDESRSKQQRHLSALYE